MYPRRQSVQAADQQPHAACRIPHFEVAAGTIRGREHDRLGRNNQDAYAWRDHGDAVIAAICDGCGSGRYSEVGARLGARLVVQALLPWASTLHHTPATQILEQVRLRLLSQLHELVRAMGEPLLATIQDYFLFTIVGTVITSRKAVVFALGDGVLVINGAYRQITYPGNAPPYLAYGLVREALDPAWYDQLGFRVHWDGPAADLQAVLIGTDGVDDLHRAADQHLPGRAESVGPLSQFWRDNRYFVNPYGITRRLALVNRTLTRHDWERRRVQHEPGLLHDDTTLIVMRRTTHRQPKE